MADQLRQRPVAGSGEDRQFDCGWAALVFYEPLHGRHQFGMFRREPSRRPGAELRPDQANRVRYGRALWCRGYHDAVPASLAAGAFSSPKTIGHLPGRVLDSAPMRLSAPPVRQSGYVAARSRPSAAASMRSDSPSCPRRCPRPPDRRGCRPQSRRSGCG